MKNLTIPFLFSLATLIFFGCAPKSTLSVGSDQRMNNDISDYKTYNWVSEEGEMPSTQIFLGSQSAIIFHQKSTRGMLKEAIETQLTAKGFTKDRNNADMLVNYSVLEEGAQLRTYTREGYSFLWEGPAQRNVEMVDVEPGTVLVNFIDAETGLQVWQGFASGALEESDLKSEQMLQAKVEAIFNQFDFSAFNIESQQATR